MVLKPSAIWVGLGSTGDWGAEVLEEQLLQRQGFGKRRKQERKTLSVLLLNPWSSCCSLWLAWTRATFGSQTCPISWEPESKELRDACVRSGQVAFVSRPGFDVSTIFWAFQITGEKAPSLAGI